MESNTGPEAERLIHRLIRLIGDDPNRQGLSGTPERVVRSWQELFSGYHDDCADYKRVFSSDYDQMVVLQDIDFFSMCEHHMLPFFGHCHVAYLPNNGSVLGVSKIARIVNAKARRLQIQERLTKDIADAIEQAIEPKGVAVVMTGLHLCMVSRGVRQHHAKMKTSRMTGLFRDDAKARGEALALIGAKGG